MNRDNPFLIIGILIVVLIEVFLMLNLPLEKVIGFQFAIFIIVLISKDAVFTFSNQKKSVIEIDMPLTSRPQQNTDWDSLDLSMYSQGNNVQDNEDLSVLTLREYEKKMLDEKWANTEGRKYKPIWKENDPKGLDAEIIYYVRDFD